MRMKIPMSLADDSLCGIDAQCDLAKLLRHASLILIDEVVLLHKRALHAIDRTLRDIMGVLDRALREVPFGGKVSTEAVNVFSYVVP